MHRLLRAAQAFESNVPATVLTVRLIASSEMIHGVLEAIRSGKAEELLPAPPPIEIWIEHYRGGLRLLRAVADADPRALGAGGSDAVATYRDLAETGRFARRYPLELEAQIRDELATPEGRRRFARELALTPRFLKHHLRIVSAEIESGQGPCDVHDPDAFFRNPAARFYLTIMLPCLMQYRITPREVLNGANRGSQEMVRILCHLDPRAREFPAVQAWLNHESGEVRRSRAAMARDWEAAGLDEGQFSMLNVKQAIAGFVKVMLQTTGRAMDFRTGKWIEPNTDARRILNVFDEVERIRTGDPLASDPDLHEVQFGSFSRQVRRWADRWKGLMPAPRRTKDSG